MADKIGVGITTTPSRTKHLELCLSQVHKHLPDNARVFIHNDVNYEGVAVSKNRCLRALADCDYVFLLDDDCFPILNDWAGYCIRAYEQSKQSHFMYLKPFAQIQRVGVEGIMEIYNNCGGVMLFFTKEFIKANGLFDERFKGYGFEHAAYSMRGYNNGIIKHPYQCPVGLTDFFYSLDYDTDNRFSIDHVPSISIEQKNKNLQSNFELFKKLIV